MSKKRTLADLMDNDFFIDFEDTKVKAERKSLTESLTRSKRTLKESINESEVESCYKRICASATEEKNRVIYYPDDAMVAVEVSKEHLKKALKLGAFSTFSGEGPFTVPAQYVDSVDIEFANNIMLDSDHCLLSVQLHGEYDDESLNDYIDGVCFVQFRDYPAFETEEEALEFFEKEIRPNGTKLAEELIDEAWAESGYKDYEGITDISDDEEHDEEDDIEDDDLEDGGTDTRGKAIKPDFSNWETLIETADMLLTGLTHNSDNDHYDDGDGYWVTEYTVWCQRYLYYTDELNNEAKLKTLCDEYSKKLPGVTFYYNIDADEELCEIGYEASKQVEESKLKEGFYKYDYDLSEDKISEEDLYKALVTDGELVSLNAGNTGEAVSFKDGGVYCDTTYEITEYDGKFSVTEFYNSDDGDWKEGDYYFETDSFETLCAELQRIFPNALIECKIKEEVEEPDSAVVDCKVNKVIAHCEDEKPVDCLGKKKPLEKPLTEEAKKMTAAELKAKHGTDDVDLINAGKEPEDRVELKEARSVAEIKAEIAKLQQELADAEVEEKKARIAKRPEVVYVWDIYLDPAEKGNWFSAEEDDITGMWEGTVYETADAAIRAGNLHLDELWDEGDLEYSRRDYYIDAQEIPLGNVSDETLSFSGLDHLIESLKESLSDVDSVRVMAWCTHHCVDFFEAVANNASKTKQRKLNKEAYKAMEAAFGLKGQEAEDLMCKGYSLWKRLYR